MEQGVCEVFTASVHCSLCSKEPHYESRLCLLFLSRFSGGWRVIFINCLKFTSANGTVSSCVRQMKCLTNSPRCNYRSNFVCSFVFLLSYKYSINILTTSFLTVRLFSFISISCFLIFFVPLNYSKVKIPSPFIICCLLVSYLY